MKFMIDFSGDFHDQVEFSDTIDQWDNELSQATFQKSLFFNECNLL